MTHECGGNLLIDALVDLDRAQAAWLHDLRVVLPGDMACMTALARWEAQLTHVKFCLHKAELQLMGGLMGSLPLPDAAVHHEDLEAIRLRWKSWRDGFETWFDGLHMPTTYRRLSSCLDVDQEAVNADAVTDLATLAELAETASIALASLAKNPSRAELEDLAFYHIIAPWRNRGIPALLDMLRWISEMVREQSDW